MQIVKFCDHHLDDIVALQKNSENEVEFIDYIETEDFYNYQYELAEIKEKVGWEM